MAQKLNTFTQFLRLQDGNAQNTIIKNECYFSMIFVGGNYLSSGSLLQKVFGGRDDVTLIAGLRLQPDGVLITTVEEPNVVLDKRSIKPGKNTNIPFTLNILVKIPAYMDSIGFSFKIVTTKRTDNFSVALDVLNDTANKSIIDGLVPTAVGKALGIGKVVKDMFDKLDSVNNKDLIQLVVTDFIIPAQQGAGGVNNLQEGYLVIFVKNEAEVEGLGIQESISPGVVNNESFLIDDGFENIKKIKKEDTVFVDVESLERGKDDLKEVAAAVTASNLSYDEVNKILKVDGKVVANTYLIFKIQKDTQRGENLNSTWSKKFRQAFDLLSNEFDKTSEKLKELQPRVTQLLNEAVALLSEETGFTPFEKSLFKVKYSEMIKAERNKFS